MAGRHSQDLPFLYLIPGPGKPTSVTDAHPAYSQQPDGTHGTTITTKSPGKADGCTTRSYCPLCLSLGRQPRTDPGPTFRAQPGSRPVDVQDASASRLCHHQQASRGKRGRDDSPPSPAGRAALSHAVVLFAPPAEANNFELPSPPEGSSFCPNQLSDLTSKTCPGNVNQRPAWHDFI
ncbi:unnamed protein product [Schistocephalus solidus]|uniref:Uncharacterized protein n=1 Tax=Schistocephalus solidus TaxID=70667 RepID=A0A183SL06_SCHSO|nr:unnamed protein product [Schistocephalus solidus]